MVKAPTAIARMILIAPSFFIGESWRNLILPNKYKVRPAPINIQIPIKTSRFNKPQCLTRSALEKNLKASASSANPNTTLTVLSQPPDLGNELSQLGKRANRAKGNASANPKPAMPDVNCIAPPSLEREPASNEPRMGPVQEKETRASVSAIKNIPAMLPAPALLSALLDKPEGKVSS